MIISSERPPTRAQLLEMVIGLVNNQTCGIEVCVRCPDPEEVGARAQVQRHSFAMPTLHHTFRET